MKFSFQYATVPLNLINLSKIKHCPPQLFQFPAFLNFYVQVEFRIKISAWIDLFLHPHNKLFIYHTCFWFKMCTDCLFIITLHYQAIFFLADVTNSSPQMLQKGKTKIDLPYKYCLIHIFCLSYLGYYIQPGSKFMCFSSANTFPNIDSLPCSLFSPAFGNLRTYISNLPIFCFHFLISLYYLLSNCHI